jgi:hypothetical protein
MSKDLKYCRLDDCFKIPNMEDDTYPFCSEEHHILWVATEFKRPVNENGKPKLTVEQMQKRLLKMGKRGEYA